MLRFADFDKLADHFERVQRSIPSVINRELERIGEHIRDAAKVKLGTYQPAAGPFAAWQQLSAATLKSHERTGVLGEGDSPELVTGDLRESITCMRVAYLEHVGSDNPIMEYQEFGTDRAPPRSILGGSMFEQAPMQQKLMSIRINVLVMTGV